jgi:ligand-binding SRPBCC domain-containing protein
LRTGIVLSRNGGALSKMLPIALGNGRQWMSWIHVEDWVRIAIESVMNDSLSGDFNLTAPKPATNGEFTEAFRKIVKFPFRAKVPAWVLKAAMGEMSAVVLASQKALPRRLLEIGFSFTFRDIGAALGDLFRDQRLVEERYVARQFAPVQGDAVFGFFSDAGNLEKLTPPWLNFHILRQSTPDVREGTIIDYTLKIHGVPVKWKTLIADWRPGVSFVDTQLKGPYSKWHHTHTFRKVPGGTLLGDEVIYRVPGGFLGKWILGAWIKGDVNAIFAYRRKVIDELFGEPPTP